MSELEELLAIFIAAVTLAALARRSGAPYPVFLALGGAVLAFFPAAPTVRIPPELALALFVAPVLLDAAYDASLRDLKANWLPLASLVVGAVMLTTFAVAVAVRFVVPSMGWAPAIALGAIVAPPDAVAATAVLRQLNPPHRILTILEGESLLNDASALLIYRLAIGAAATGSFSIAAIAPTLALSVVGSLIVGPALGWAVAMLLARVEHVPTAIILQFITTFSVWIAAEALGLSAVLTMVSYAATVAQLSPQRTPARIRVPTYAVWETAVFAVNIFAFIFIGLQIGPIVGNLETVDRDQYFTAAGVVLATVIIVRLAWHMSVNGLMRWRHARVGFHPPRPMLRPSVGSGLIISWSGMRGIITLAAALALPQGFPHRDLITLVAFSVVLGTLVLQGMTLKPLMRWLDLQDDDPVGQELRAGRRRVLDAAMSALAPHDSPLAKLVSNEFKLLLAEEPGGNRRDQSPAHRELRREAVRAAREALLEMRATQDMGDDAFHQLEEQLDWFEMTSEAPM